MYIKLWENESVWPDVWPQNKCRSLWPTFPGPVIWPYILKAIWCMNILTLWPIFHGLVILSYILKTIWCMNIILWDYGSVWPEVWPQNKCRSMWPTFHGPVILSYISNTVWCMSVIFSDNETVWPKLWPQSEYKSTIFHGLVMLLNIFKIISWMNIIAGIMDQCVTQTDLIKYMEVSDLYFMVQRFCFISWRLFDGEMLYLG